MCDHRRLRPEVVAGLVLTWSIIGATCLLAQVDYNKQRAWLVAAIERCARSYSQSPPRVQERVTNRFEWFLDSHLEGCGRDKTGLFPTETLASGEDRIEWYLETWNRCLQGWAKGKFVDDVKAMNVELRRLIELLRCRPHWEGVDKDAPAPEGWRRTHDGELIPDIPPPEDGSAPSPVLPKGPGGAPQMLEQGKPCGEMSSGAFCCDGGLERQCVDAEWWTTGFPCYQAYGISPCPVSD